MTLPASGPLAMTDIQTEFGGTNPIGLNEYYAGGGLVPAGTSGTYGAVPSSGALSIQNFYGTSNYIPVYIEELFSTYLYNGNGGANTITNGINLSGNGGLIWTKSRAETGNNWFVDTARGINFGLYSNSTNAQFSDPGTFTSFNSTGYSMNNSYGDLNSGQAGRTYVSWTFRKQPKFFDIVTYTGNGVNRTIAHNLGSVPGCIIIKRTNTADNWIVYHRSLGNDFQLFLNLTLAKNYTNEFNFTTPTSTVFSVNGNDAVNASGGTYVAYLFAHDAGGFGLTGTDNVISCGSFTTDGSGNATVDLGYEPQWVLIKSTSFTDSWYLIDVMRGASQTATNTLRANTSSAESAYTSGYFAPTATGFTTPVAGLFTGGQSFIYIAIRRGPMKVPTLGTSVFAPALGSGAAPGYVSGFPVDLGIERNKAFSGNTEAGSRMTGARVLQTNSTSAEASSTNTKFDYMNGFFAGTKGTNEIAWMFRRAPGFFDEVCTSVFVDGTLINHNLSVTPELIIVKTRSAASSWMGAINDAGNIRNLSVNTTSAGFLPGLVYSSYFNATTIDPTGIRNGAGGFSKGNPVPVVIYLFASCPGVSSIGVVTHVEPTTVVCGFIPRFILIKSTQDTGTNDWFVFDSARGLVPGNDPYLRLNSVDAENTPYGPGDLVDVTANGFIMNGFNGGNYLYLAIA